MRCTFTLLAMVLLIAEGASAQCPHRTGGTIPAITAQDSLKMDWSFHTVPIPDFSVETVFSRTPGSSIKYSTTDGSPMRLWRMYYTPTVSRRYDTLLINRVATNPSQTSDFYKPLSGLVDPTNVTNSWINVGWIRADLDPDGHLLRLWGEDAFGSYWVWRESKPFPSSDAPAPTVGRQVLE